MDIIIYEKTEKNSEPVLKELVMSSEMNKDLKLFFQIHIFNIVYWFCLFRKMSVHPQEIELAETTDLRKPERTS